MTTGPKRTEPSNGGLLGRTFKYRKDTDLAATFARIRREQKREQQPQAPSTVRTLVPKAKR